MDTDARGLSHIREATLRATMHHGITKALRTALFNNKRHPAASPCRSVDKATQKRLGEGPQANARVAAFIFSNLRAFAVVE
jgi:hypothetical protein